MIRHKRLHINIQNYSFKVIANVRLGTNLEL